MGKNKQNCFIQDTLPFGFVFSLVMVCLVLQGCASTKMPHIYRIEGKEYKDFKSLDDEGALKAVIMTYNATVQGTAEEIAKAITLRDQMEKLRKRKTGYITSSGVFEMIVFEEIDLSIWSEEDLVKTYNELRQKAVKFSHLRALTEEENAKKIIYMVGMQGLVNELERRENLKNAQQVASKILSAALSVAVSLI